MLNETNIETMNDSIRRAELLLKFLLHTTYRKILCITHGYFMRAVRIYLAKQKYPEIKFTKKEILNDLRYDYYKGFFIQFTGSSFEIKET